MTTESTVGVSTEIENGSGVVIINDVYQTPTTSNNEGNNYFYTYGEQTGINTITFTGITSTNGERIASEFDVNQNQVPRGGLVVSVGSTPGLGYAPLYGAIIEPIVVAGEITGIEFNNVIGTTTNIEYAEYNNIDGTLRITTYGSNSSPVFNVDEALYFKESGRLLVTGDTPLGGSIQKGDIVLLQDLEFSCTNSVATLNVIDASYNENTGNIEITTSSPNNNVSIGQQVRLDNLIFECSSGGAPSQQAFPSGANGYDFIVGSVINDSTFIVNVGTSTLPHTYINSGTVTVGITTTIFPDKQDAFIVESTINDESIVVNVGLSTIDHTYVQGGTFSARSEFEFSPKGDPDFVYLDNLEFACPNGETAGLTTTIFPIAGEEGFPFVGRIDAATVEVFVGVSTIVHEYVGGGTVGEYRKNNPGSGYNSNVNILIYEDGHTGTEAEVLGIPGPGGELTFSVINPGSGYVDPQASAPDPVYANLPVIGYSRRTVGRTTETGKNLFITVDVGAATTTAIGRSEYFEVSNYELTNQGYSFLPGDVIEVVGLVTDKRLSAPIEPFQITVTETFTDNFAAWNFGETDYIDSIKALQDGVRTRFPLIYNGEELAFEQNLENEDSSAVDMSSLLLIYVNTVLQVPNVNYFFDGGTTFQFSRAPFPEDDIDIYFYQGKRGVDSLKVLDVNESIRPGDELQMRKNNAIPGTKTQDLRTVTGLEASDTVRTNTYFGRGDLEDVEPREVAWDKQKRDVFIYGEVYTKVRDSIEPIIRPKASIIRTVLPGDSVIYLDSAELFDYESNIPGQPIIPLSNIQGRMYTTVPKNQVPTELIAEVQSNGQLKSTLDVVIPNNSGYVNPVNVTIAPPPDPNGARARNVSVNLTTGGRITSASVGVRGSGYDPANPPTVLVEPFTTDYEDILQINTFQGFSGIITGIVGNTSGQDTITFQYRVEPGTIAAELQPGDSISVVNTVVGGGNVESIKRNNTDIVGVCTQFLDCVYEVSQHIPLSFTGEIVTRVRSLNGNGNINITGDNLGQFSWGKLTVTRDLDNLSPRLNVDGTEYDQKMENFPTFVRTTGGLRGQGGIAKEV